MRSNITSSKYPIGLSVPFVNGSSGYFQQTFDTNEQIKNNLTNFLKTKRGERRMMPEFGTQLYTLLFEQRTDNLPEILKSMISEELRYWVPEVKILGIDIIDTENSEGDDNYKMRVSIRFSVNSTDEVDILVFDLENVKI